MKTFGSFTQLASRYAPIRYQQFRYRSKDALNLQRATDIQQQFDNVRPFEAITGPKGLPYFGTMFHYKFGRFKPVEYHKALMYNFRKYGNIYKETISGDTRVHLFDPEDIQTVYNAADKYPHTSPVLLPSKIYREQRDMSAGFGNTNGEEWYHLRHAVQQLLLSKASLNSYFPRTREVVDDFVQRVKCIRREDGHVTDLANEIKRWNLESAFVTIMDTRLGCLSEDMDPVYQSMIDAHGDVFDSSVKLQFSSGLFKYVSTPIWYEHVKSEDAFINPARKIFEAELSKLKTLAESGNIGEKYHFLSHLMFRTNLSYNEAETTALSLTFDGLNATVPSLMFMLYCLGTNPHVQEKLYDEIKRVLPDPSTDVTAEHLAKMRYLTCVIKEGLRVFPNGTEITRVPQKDLVIQGYHIPAGTAVDMHTNLVMKHEEKYAVRADDFIPERWSRDTHTARVPPILAIPFGVGNRNCIGKRISTLEMQLVLLRFVQNFHIHWPHRHRMGQLYKILMMPDCEPDLQFIPRKTGA